jgi:hypothetical protein
LFSRPLPREIFEAKYLTGNAGAAGAAGA